jgi:hypothetical protein
MKMELRWVAVRRLGVAVVGAIALCTLIVLGFLAPRAGAARPEPVITSGPTIGGTPEVGATLTASGNWKGAPLPEATWTWLRCAGSCTVISSGTSATYAVRTSDIGTALRVRLTVTNKHGSDERSSEPTAVVAAPTLSPSPSGTPAPRPTPAPSPSFDNTAGQPAGPLPGVGGTPLPAADGPLMMKPFPIVRIKGVLTAKGARVTLLRVTAPRGTRTVLLCRGRGCPARRLVSRSGVRRLRRFERDLRAGIRLTFTITKPGYVGKRTVIVIRRGAAPWRRDRCLRPGASKAVRCEAA